MSENVSLVTFDKDIEPHFPEYADYLARVTIVFE